MKNLKFCVFVIALAFINNIFCGNIFPDLFNSGTQLKLTRIKNNDDEKDKYLKISIPKDSNWKIKDLKEAAAKKLKIKNTEEIHFMSPRSNGGIPELYELSDETLIKEVEPQIIILDQEKEKAKKQYNYLNLVFQKDLKKPMDIKKTTNNYELSGINGNKIIIEIPQEENWNIKDLRIALAKKLNIPSYQKIHLMRIRQDAGKNQLYESNDNQLISESRPSIVITDEEKDKTKGEYDGYKLVFGK